MNISSRVPGVTRNSGWNAAMEAQRQASTQRRQLEASPSDFPNPTAPVAGGLASALLVPAERFAAVEQV